MCKAHGVLRTAPACSMCSAKRQWTDAGPQGQHALALPASKMPTHRTPERLSRGHLESPSGTSDLGEWPGRRSPGIGRKLEVPCRDL